MITTVEKAKALKPYIEKMITIAKVDTMANRRLLFSRLDSKTTIDKLFEDVAPRYKERQGGYTRVLKLYNRKGDNATMALIELVEEELPKKVRKTTKKKSATVNSTKTAGATTKEISTDNTASLNSFENEENAEINNQAVVQEADVNEKQEPEEK
jgi:large subunit ribosomal protein L17